jgi:hypothetical protein
MTDDLNPQWERHFEGIADELMHLAIACDVKLNEPEAIKRVLRNDLTVCGRKDEETFQKLRNLFVAFYDSVGKAVDRLGPEDTRKLIDAIRARKRRQVELGGRAASGSSTA